MKSNIFSGYGSEDYNFRYVRLEDAIYMSCYNHQTDEEVSINVINSKPDFNLLVVTEIDNTGKRKETYYKIKVLKEEIY